ncbi:MAG: PhzF family phenazine biosynthesis protein [Woeseiaceae bacterium]
MRAVPCLQVDAFTDKPFAGNPAAVCLLETERDAEWMQAVAAELNLSETAFVRPLEDGFELRWFTPVVEVDLCGHATLASAHVLWSEGIVNDGTPIHFDTKSGVLECQRRGDLIQMDFPATPAEPMQPDAELAEALGVVPTWTGGSNFDRLVFVDSPETLRSIQPDFARLRTVPVRGVIVTSVSDDTRFDFLSRFFGPAVGIDEDPVTGSAHCCLAPFWSERLDTTEMTAFQASPRGGIVHVRVAGERVLLAGNAVTVLRGELV